jgi:NTP pyrophosphatase (non-canonical NTP hydrolase)
MRYFNELKPEELERLAVLSEELGEAQQIIGKILRHGYSSSNPLKRGYSPTNRRMLEKELGDIDAAVRMLCDAHDLNYETIFTEMSKKQESIKRWLHHQEVEA